MANDIVWNSQTGLIYMSVPGFIPGGNDIRSIDPTTGNVIASQFAGSEPDALTISDDDQFIYAGLDGQGAVQRFLLPSLAPDISYSLGSDPLFGPYFALDLQVAPGASHTTAVTRGLFGLSPMADGGIEIFDDSAARPNIAPGFGRGGLYDSIQWGCNPSVMLAANYEDTAFDFYILAVNVAGIVQIDDITNAFSNFFSRIHYDAGTNLIYSDDGHVVDPSSGAPVGVLAAAGIMVPDSGIDSAFFLGQTQSQFGTDNFTLASFDLTTLAPVNSVVISAVAGFPIRLIRWGTDGLAFNTTGGQLVVISGSFVGPPGTQRHAVPAMPFSIRRTWSSSRIRQRPR